MPPPTERCEPCGKWTHRTKGDAMAGALASSRKFDGQPYRTYRCPEGNGWHITRKPDRPTTEEDNQ